MKPTCTTLRTGSNPLQSQIPKLLKIGCHTPLSHDESGTARQGRQHLTVSHSFHLVLAVMRCFHTPPYHTHSGYNRRGFNSQRPQLRPATKDGDHDSFIAASDSISHTLPFLAFDTGRKHCSTTSGGMQRYNGTAGVLLQTNPGSNPGDCRVLFVH